jgi:hypothetical protein
MTSWGSTPTADPGPGAHDALPARSEVRLRMKDRAATHGLDGAWWPRSRDAGAEFPELVLVMSSWVGPVSRVTYHVGDWDPAGHEMTVEGWLVELAGSTALQPHTVLVAGTHERQRTLLVVPSGVTGAVARAVLRSTAGPAAVLSAEDMLTSNGVRLDLGRVEGIGSVDGVDAPRELL